jgi:hypothetical protein
MAQKANDPVLEAILKQYEDNSKPSSSGSKTYDLKNYFSTFLPDKVKSGSKQIRILPAPDGGTPFKEIYVHTKQVDGQWKKFPCLKGNFDKDCPFCEARAALLATGKDSDKELAKKFGSRKMYVLRVIDREFEDDGVKFWRFNHDYRNQGIFDKLITIIKKRGNITDLETGRDITIDLGRDQNNKTIVTGLVDEDPAAVSEDASVIETWMADDRTWQDVYSIRNYDYLYLIVKGKEPAWDKVNEKWVDKEELDEEANSDKEITMDETEIEKDLGGVEETQSETVEASVDADEEEDDLPF